MATQVLPSWLTWMVTTVTDDGGAPVTTESSLAYLPLTYYGPSIPLGADWTWGGLTSPAATPTTTSSTPITSATPTPTPTPTPTSSLTSPTSSLASSSRPSSTSALPSSTGSSTLSSSSTISSSSTSASPSGSPSSRTSSNHAALIGGIVGGVLGLIILVTALICCWIICARRRRRRRNSENVESGWIPGEAPPSTSPRRPGEGSPRQSGEEHDTFLRQSRSATDGMRESNASARLVEPSRPEAAAHRTSDADSDSSSTSGYGNLIEPQGEAFTWGRDSLFGFPAPPPSQWPGPSYQPIMPVGELFRLVEEHEPSETESVRTGVTRQSSLRPPPRLVDPERAGSSLGVPGVSMSSKHSTSTQNSSSRSRSRPPTTDPEAEEAEGEDVTFLTARRVQMRDLDLSNAKPTSSSSALDVAGSTFGRWSGITQFGRMSWLTKAFPYGSTGRSRSPSSYGSANSKGSSKKSAGSSARSRRSNLSRTRPDSYQILEQGRNIYREVEEELSGMPRPHGNDSGVGFGVIATGGGHPMDGSLGSKSEKSEKSEKSGQTVFYDAVSTFAPGTPVSRAVTPSLPVVRAMASEGRLAPPAYAEHVGPGENQDILDAPVPAALSPFGTVSTTSTQARAVHPIPPGLALPNPAVWRRQSSSSIASPGTETSLSAGPLPTPQIAAGDILEEAPPNSDMGWRRLANSGSVPTIAIAHSTRTSVSLPQYYHPLPMDRDISQEASVHQPSPSELVVSDGFFTPTDNNAPSSFRGGHSAQPTGTTYSSSDPSTRRGNNTSSSSGPYAHSYSIGGQHSQSGSHESDAAGARYGHVSLGATGAPASAALFDFATRMRQQQQQQQQQQQSGIAGSWLPPSYAQSTATTTVEGTSMIDTRTSMTDMSTVAADTEEGGKDDEEDSGSPNTSNELTDDSSLLQFPSVPWVRA